MAALNNDNQSDKAGFFVLYGCRRVGKTELIKQFIQNKDGLYFLADRLPEKENLRAITRLAGSLFDDPFLAEFPDWYTFFAYLKSKITRKTILVIDEFPYLLETNKALSSVFQKGWDETLHEKTACDMPFAPKPCRSGNSIIKSLAGLSRRDGRLKRLNEGIRLWSPATLCGRSKRFRIVLDTEAAPLSLTCRTRRQGLTLSLLCT